MGKGLKQMVAEAEAASDYRPEPVAVSGEAFAALSGKVREWTGNKDAALRFGDPRDMGAKSPFAATNLDTHEMRVNIDRLLLNPHRVLLTLTPFRLRQEAVLTGAILHEAAHQRHSHWMNQTGDTPLLHTPKKGMLKKEERVPTKQTVALARVLEEPRIEGLMAKECNRLGALGLAWTMRATAAMLLPPTILSDDSEQMVMDIVTSWILRAGRQYAVSYHTSYTPTEWTFDFNSLLVQALAAHFADVDPAHLQGLDPQQAANVILDMLVDAVQTDAGSDTGPGMIDRAKAILDLLFPETPGDGPGAPMPGDPHEQGGQGEKAPPSEGGSEPDTGSEGDEEEEESEQEDEGTGSEAETGEDGEDNREDWQKLLDEMFGDDKPEPTEEEGDLATEAMQMALSAMEEQADRETKAEGEAESKQAPPPDPQSAKGVGQGDAPIRMGAGFRDARPEEREVKANAVQFLREVINPSETSRVVLSDSPSPSVDGAALAAWRAGGQVSEPRFFRRTHRTAMPAPPVKVGVAVDVSFSMEELAYPSALLSFALASAAVDMRNFAGRGINVESCLVHWGSKARVIQHNGEGMPGLYEHACDQTTSAMHDAMDLIEVEMPGFHEVSPTPENRLLVHFTDWQLGSSAPQMVEPMGKALAAGVNILTVVPASWSARGSKLDWILGEAAKSYPIMGKHTLMRFDPKRPEEVWSVAQEVLLG